MAYAPQDEALLGLVRRLANESALLGVAIGYGTHTCFQTRRGRDALSCRLRSKADFCEIRFQR
ncbi:hypothetical protein ACVIKO_002068 [Rhizobium ruizarguesonis]